MKKFLLLLSACLCAAGAFAQEVTVKFDPYVSLRGFYGYHGMSIPSESKTSYADNETDMTYMLQGNSRVGANFAVGKVKAVVELGLDPNSTTTVPLRLAYATYDFGAFQFKVGQDYTPYTWLAGAADVVNDNNMQGFGAAYDGRKPQIMISTNGLYVSFIAPNKTIANGYGISGDLLNTASTAVDTTVLIPKTAIGYDYKADGVIVGLGGAYNAVKINESSQTTTDALDGKKIVSYLGYVHADLTLGMLLFKANFAYGQNAGNFGLNLTSNNTDSVSTKTAFGKNPGFATEDNDSIKNSKHMEGYVNIIAKLSSDFQIGAAAGYQSDKLDIDGAKADTQIIYAVDAKYAVDKNLAFCPTFSYRDYVKNGADADQPTEYYTGVKIQFDIK